MLNSDVTKRNMEKEASMINEMDVCVYCGEELSRWEKNRSYCWLCDEKWSITYNEKEENIS